MMTDEQEDQMTDNLYHVILKSLDSTPVHVALTALTRCMSTIIALTTNAQGDEEIIRIANETLSDGIREARQSLSANSRDLPN